MSTAGSVPPKPLAERLVLEAVEIVRTSGPDSLSLREVQRRAGVSPAAAYRHFRDRAALLLAVAQKSAGLLADHIAAAIAVVPASGAGAVTARARLLAGCEGYIAFAVENPGLYRAIFFSDEQIEDLVAPSEWARNSAGDGGYNLLVAAVQDVVISTNGSQPDDWDPLVIWSACHGLAMLRLDAALRSLSNEGFIQARDRVLTTITMAVPLTTVPER
ncbi:TetR/AcrR family transcriptional regulator [Brevibacterium picturae]|uniref:TetR/AcrR family transcriptional regulator n=1 Tax=Brevibacterium picturae TaxID=260553 RepID=A0ABN2CV34_9MICO